jgi:hypothetical protein
MASVEDGPREIRAPFKLVDRKTGELLAFALRNVTDSDRLHRALVDLPYAASRRTSGMISRSITFGFMPREGLRQDFCRPAKLIVQYPDVGVLLEEEAAKYGEILREHHPIQHAAQIADIQAVAPRWRMAGGVYTSGILNKNNPLVYHRDRGNFDSSWNSMVVITRGVSGGLLVMPEIGCHVRFNDGDVIWSNAARLIHGVTPVVPMRPGGYRISAVFYALKAMCQCREPAEELARVKAIKTRNARARHSDNKEALAAKIGKRFKGK